jgi:autotransporter-associated beta strand protein
MKSRSNPFLHISAAAVAALALPTSAGAADLTWDNGAATGNWNTIDTNWTGSTWNNGTPDNAIFNTSTGAINLTQAINAGSFTFGLGNANTTGSFSGSALAVSGDLLAQADGNNGPGGPTLSFSNNVSVTGDLKIARRVVEITGGTFTANRVLSAGSWGRLLISGGTVTATNGIDDSINGGNTMSVVLFGGSLYTPYIKTTTVGFTGLPSDGVVLSGGTLYATANNSEFIQSHDPTGGSWGTRNNVGVGTGGANINTNGFNITINKSMQDYGGAGVLTKSGEGTLTLSTTNSYTGGTTVNSGTLVLSGGAGGTSVVRGAVTVNAGATVSLINDDGTGLGFNSGAKVTSLTINGGTLTTAGSMHVWNLSGINMTGGTLQSNNGVSDATGAQMEWINANVTTNASASTATLGGRIRMRADGGATGILFNVGDGVAASDLLISAAVTEASGGMGITKSGAGTMTLSSVANNYTGVTTFEGGILNAASLANNGANSSLGNGTGDNNQNTIGLLFRGGTLQYTGSSAQSTNRQIRMHTSGGTIDASGSNPGATLSFTHSGTNTNLFEAPGTRTLTLTGSNTGDNTFAIKLEDQGANATSLIKSGSGKWVLSGNSSYGGQTDITSGTLVAASSTALGIGGHNGATMSWVRDGATLALQGGISLDEHFHVWGSGVDGLGAVRSISGNNALTNAPGGAPGYALRSNTTVGVDADKLTVSGFYQEAGSFGLIKVGAGTLELSGSNSYNGATTVSAGTLVVNGNISTSSLTTVDSGATLEGTGTVGATTINGIFAPGNSIGTINVIGTLDLNGTSNFEIDPTLGLGLNRAADLANVTGSVSYGGILNVLYGGDASNFTAGMSFNLFDASLGFTDSFTSINLPSLTGGLSWQNDLATSGSIVVVPEPGATLLGGLGLLALLRRRR